MIEASLDDLIAETYLNLSLAYYSMKENNPNTKLLIDTATKNIILMTGLEYQNVYGVLDFYTTVVDRYNKRFNC